MAQIDILLERMEALQASDLHLKVETRPRYRVHGSLEEAADLPVLSREMLERMTNEILGEEQLQVLEKEHSLDFAYGSGRLGRFRCNYFTDHWGRAAVFRRIPARVPTLAELGLPKQVERFAHLKRGLVLVTGATGAGKSSTLAALVDVINSNYRKHIITLEDPIEYLHPIKRSIIHQRGVHYDIHDFGSGIHAALRESPDVLVVGEMRDLDSIRQALTAAEIGVLVFGTLHTNSAAGSVDRIVDVFPPEEQAQVRVQLAQSLAGVVSQVLLRRRLGSGRVPAAEVLVANTAVANIVREGRTQDLLSVLQGGKGHGMQTMDDALEQLVQQGTVETNEAALHAHNKARFERLLGHEGSGVRRRLTPR
ncbi:MAG: PilT/PilU family type 4a pilus ATPase [Planctomycetota bacterium]